MFSKKVLISLVGLFLLLGIAGALWLSQPEQTAVAAPGNTCTLSTAVTGSGTIDVTTNALAASLSASLSGTDSAFRVEIGPENSHVILENSEIFVKFAPYTIDFDQFAIREFRIKSAGNQDQVGFDGYFNADSDRGGLMSASILYNGADKKTVQLRWYREGGAWSSNTQEVTIYPNGRFLQINYVNVKDGLNIVDLGRPGGANHGAHLAYGGDSWIRGYITHREQEEELKGSYYNRYPADGVNDPEDGGSLNYNDHFIVGVYNTANGVGFGRVMPVKDTHIIKLLLDPNQRRGLEFFPYPFFQPHDPFTGYLYGVTGGGDDLISYGQQLADGKLGGVEYPCGTEVTLTANANSGWQFTSWGGDLSGSQNPQTLTLTGNHFVSATFRDALPPTVSGRNPAPGATNVPVDSNVVLHVTDSGKGVDQASIVLRVDGVNVTASAQITGAPADYTVTYDPPQNFPYNATIPVTVDACDLESPPNCMARVSYSFSTMEAETTPPVISNVNVVSGVDFAVITWNTDEPATSRVDYGLTTGYGGSRVDNTLKTAHRITLTGLTPDTLYNYRITSADEYNNQASTANATFRTRVLTPITSDDFNYCGPLKPFWTFVNPLGDSSYTLNGAQMVIAVPGGVEHDIWPSTTPGTPTNRAPRIMQPATDAHNLEVKFDSGVGGADLLLQGLLIEQDAETFLRVNFQRQDGTPRLYVISYATGQPPAILRNIALPGFNISGPLYLRVTRDADTWQIAYSNNGTTWSSTSVSLLLNVTQVGVFAGNGGTNPPAFTARVDYFFNLSAPLDPEDAQALYLPVEVVGDGRVDKNPTCGNPVELTAVPAAGWRFMGWSGAPIDGVTNARVTVNFARGDAVTATFDEIDYYTLNVNVVSTGGGAGGTVTRSPDLASYPEDTVVTLTANPAPGWRFDGWSGAVTGTANPAVVTMNANKQVTATFSRATYTLTVNVVGEGQVTRSAPGPYQYNQQVTLTAVPAPGYTFAGWSGDAAGENPVITLTMTDNKTVTAMFLDTAGKPRSDDFNSCTLDTTRWTFINTHGGSLQMNGTQARISVPAGPPHSLWENVLHAPRLMTAADDRDFEVEVKFESALTQRYQFQGILVQADENNFLRLEYLHDGSGLRLFGASIINGVAAVRANLGVTPPGGDGLYLRVRRLTDVWTVSYSGNGQTWTPAFSFGQPLAVNTIGVYGGNEPPAAGQPAPGFTAVVDYFFNTAAPITPEDGRTNTLTVNLSGRGQVTAVPNKPTYECFEQVTLTAQAVNGWQFDRWTGDLSGGANPAVLTITGPHVVTANFIQITTTHEVYLPLVIKR